MIQGLISDIHGNKEALDAVIKDMQEQGVQRLICLGDIVGYGPYPGECLDMCFECGVVLMGNHEEALMNSADELHFNPRAKRAIDWTREHLKSTGTEEIRKKRWDILNNLKMQARDNKYLFVHASPREPTREYVLPRDCRNTEKMRDIFSMIQHVCFVGHTHVPGVFLEDLSFTKPDDLWGHNYFIEDGEKALINIGSVGQPRDGDTRASYCIIDNDDPSSVTVIFRRVEYDVEATARAIEENADLDNYLAERLRHGR